MVQWSYITMVLSYTWIIMGSLQIQRQMLCQYGSHHFWYLVLVLVSNIISEEPLHTLPMVWVSSGNKVSAIGPCVHPLIILGGDVKDYFKLGWMVKIPSARFQSRFCETQMNRKWKRKRQGLVPPGKGERLLYELSCEQPCSAWHQSVSRQVLLTSKHYVDEQPVTTSCWGSS